MSISPTGPVRHVAKETTSRSRSPKVPRAAVSARKSDRDLPLRRSEKRVIQTFLSALEPLANLRGSIPLPFVTTFLMVAFDERKGVGTYARMAGIHRAKMSRYIRSIGDRARNGGPGLGLVTVRPYPAHSQRVQVLLTAKGRVIARAIFRQMQKASNRKH